MEEKIINAVKEALEGGKRNFKESVELAVNLKDIDLSNPKNRIDLELALPKGRGKDIKVALFGAGELAVKAKPYTRVISPEELDKLSDKKAAKALAEEYDFFLADASLMPTIGKKLGTVLGPRGKMPKPISPLADPVAIVNNLKSTVRIKSKESKTLHVPVGTKDMSSEDLAENIETVLKKLEEGLERGKLNIGSVYVKTTMGKSVRIV
ncbi:MAG: 50S ribosomal protein L1 [Candidatus Thermoplasmatota archaeon]|nr:50S ribosomal protein L1 [Candidatus Thermoplasmatota archaeon]